MVSLIAEKRDDIAALCRQYAVVRLELFGSAARGDFDVKHSDVDLLVEFDRPAGTNAFHQYFDFRNAMAKLLDRKVDLINAKSMRNRYFIESVNKARTLIYAA